MVEQLAFWALFFLVLAPFATILHEFGHAIAALLFTDRSVSIRLGRTPRLSWTLGRLTLQAGLLSGFGGWCRIPRMHQLETKKRLAIYLAGPLTSLSMAASFVALALVTSPSPWQIRNIINPLIWMLLGQGIVTLVPLRYPRWLPVYGGRYSDGMLVVRALKSRSIDVRHIN